MKLHYLMLSIAAACTFVFSGCTSENGEKSVVGDTDVEMRASNPDDVVLGAGQPQFVEFFSFY